MAAKGNLAILWSKAAVDSAGESLAHIQHSVRLECSEIAGQARGWFLHVVQPEGAAAYLCNGKDDGQGWRVWVQLAEFVAMDPLPDDHPDPASRGKVVKMPYAVETSDNKLFADIGYLEH